MDDIESMLTGFFSMPDHEWIPRPPATELVGKLLDLLDSSGFEIRRRDEGGDAYGVTALP